jgi:hypothetical protein
MSKHKIMIAVTSTGKQTVGIDKDFFSEKKYESFI